MPPSSVCRPEPIRYGNRKSLHVKGKKSAPVENGRRLIDFEHDYRDSRWRKPRLRIWRQVPSIPRPGSSDIRHQAVPRTLRHIGTRMVSLAPSGWYALDEPGRRRSIPRASINRIFTAYETVDGLMKVSQAHFLITEDHALEGV